MGFNITNATKGVIVALINSAIALLVAFGVDLSDAQMLAVDGFVNAMLVAWIGLTYKDSPARDDNYDK